MKRTASGMAWLVILALWAGSAFAQDQVPRITKEELKEMLSNPDVVILDVRVGQEWATSDKKILGAIRENPAELNSWIHSYPKDKTLVLYCS